MTPSISRHINEYLVAQFGFTVGYSSTAPTTHLIFGLYPIAYFDKRTALSSGRLFYFLEMTRIYDLRSGTVLIIVTENGSKLFIYSYTTNY